MAAGLAGASTGMGDSIAAGLRPALSAGVVGVLGDMPFILASSIERVIEAAAVDAISVPVHAGEYGHPVAFGRTSGRI
jgi:molybdenum cofactor cytidylyltransferase